MVTFFEYRVTSDWKETGDIERSVGSDTQRLQRVLIREKNILIENCLFGVDINPNSVNICRLRLWIELLKHAYYRKDTDYQALEVLPNIDINIKQGDHYWELRACDYYNEFEKPKIIYPDIAKERRFTLDTEGYYLTNTAYFIPSSDKYVLGILNSKLVFNYYKRVSSVLGDPDKGGRMRWFRQHVSNIPIAKADDNTKKKIESNVDQILTVNVELKADTSELEEEIGIVKESV